MSCPNWVLLNPFPSLVKFLEEDTMIPLVLIETLTGLIDSKTTTPPYTAVVPHNTKLDFPYGDSGTLRERILRLPQVIGVKIGTTNGVALEHAEVQVLEHEKKE